MFCICISVSFLAPAIVRTHTPLLSAGGTAVGSGTSTFFPETRGTWMAGGSMMATQHPPLRTTMVKPRSHNNLFSSTHRYPQTQTQRATSTLPPKYNSIPHTPPNIDPKTTHTHNQYRMTHILSSNSVHPPSHIGGRTYSHSPHPTTIVEQDRGDMSLPPHMPHVSPGGAICVQIFNDSLALRFTLLFALCYVLHRRENQGIRCCRFFTV